MVSDGIPLRCLVLSAVRHASDYASLIARHPDFELAGIAEEPAAPAEDLRTARALADQMGVPFQIFDRTGEIGVEDDLGRIDVVVICSEPARHAGLALAALSKGMHTIVDKPIAIDPEDASAIASLAAERGLRCSAVNRALLPKVQQLKRWVSEGRLGLPRSIDAEFLASGRDFSTTVERPELVLDTRLSGGGELMNFLGYMVDQIRTVTGCEVVAVYAESGSLFGGLHSDFGVEDAGVLSVLMSNGVVASLTVARVPVVPGPGFATSSLRLIGSHGHIELDTETSSLQRFDRQGKVHDVRLLGVDRDAFSATLDDMSGSLRTGRDLAYSALDAAAAVATIAAAYESARTGREVMVPRVYDRRD